MVLIKPSAATAYSGGAPANPVVTVTPSVTSILPTSGTTAGNTAVTITGQNFSGSPTVTFAGVTATSIVVVSATSITCVTPAGTAGKADVKVAGNGAGNQLWTYTSQTTPTPSGSATTILNTASGGAQSIQGAANLAAALSAMGASSTNGGGGNTVTWDTANTLSISGAPKVFLFTWINSSGAEVDQMIYKALSVTGPCDFYMQWKMFQPAGFDNTNSSAGAGGRKLFVGFRESTNNSRTVITLSSNPGSRVRLFRDNTYTGDPTTAGDDGSRAEARWNVGGGSSNGGTVPAPSGPGAPWHPDDNTGAIATITIRVRSETAAGAGNGILECWWNDQLCDSEVLYASPAGWQSEVQWGGPTWIGTLTQNEARWDFKIWTEPF